MPEDALLKNDKATLRSEALARRDAMPASERAAAVETVTQRPFPVAITPGAIVSGYSPMKSEFNPVPLLRKLADAGATLALPVTPRTCHRHSRSASTWAETIRSSMVSGYTVA